MRIYGLKKMEIKGYLKKLAIKRVLGMEIGYELTPSAFLELNWLSIIPAIRHSFVCKKK
jgi:hypothetical protein